MLQEHDAYQIVPQNDYQAMMRRNSKVLLNHVTTIHTEKTRSIIALVPDGGNYKSLPEELQQTRKVNIAWTRMDSKKPCFTIDTGHNHHFTTELIVFLLFVNLREYSRSLTILNLLALKQVS